MAVVFGTELNDRGHLCYKWKRQRAIHTVSIERITCNHGLSVRYFVGLHQINLLR